MGKKYFAVYSLLWLGAYSTVGWAYQVSSAQNGYIEKHSPIVQERKLGSGDTHLITVPGFGAYSPFSLPLHTNCFSNSSSPDGIKYYNPTGSLSLSMQSDSATIQNIFNVSAGASGGYGPFSASVEASYSRENSDNRYRMTMNYAQTYGATAIFFPPMNWRRPEEMLLSGYQSLYEHNLPAFLKTCGDTYISIANAGAALVVSVSINFQSQTAKQSFSTKFSAGVQQVASVTASFSKAVKESHVAATISVAALQRGGSPQDLAKIFGEKNSKGDYPLVTCSPETVEECAKIINGVIDYAQTNFAQGVNLKDPQTLYYWGPQYNKYSDLGLNLNPINISPATRANIKWLTDTLQVIRTREEYLNRYIANITTLTNGMAPQDLAPKVNTIRASYKKVLDSIMSGTMNECFSSNADQTCGPFTEGIKKEVAYLHSTGIDAQADGLMNVIYIYDPVYNAATYAGILIPINVSNKSPVLSPEEKSNGRKFNPSTSFGFSGEYLLMETVAGKYHHTFPICNVNFDAPDSRYNFLMLKESNPDLNHLYKPMVYCPFNGNNINQIRSISGEITLSNPWQFTHTGEILLAQSERHAGSNLFYMLDKPRSTEQPAVINPIIVGYENLNFNPL